jgi:hypothetical protein
MSGYRTYQIYQSLKLHFTTDYNAVKYNFKTGTKQATFEKRRDRYFFEKLSRKFNAETLIDYFTANLIENPNVWIGDVNDKVYNDYVARQDKLTYMMNQDMKTMSNKGYSFNELCTTSDDLSSNPLLEALRGGEISTESVVMVDILVNFLSSLKKNLSDPLGINTDTINLLQKYKLIMLRRPLPQNKIKEKLLLSFTT